MRHYKIAAIPADGIGKEVIPAGIRVLKTLAELEGTFSLSFETYPWGSDYYHRHGRMMAENGLEILKGFDAIFFGAVGHPTVPDHVTLWGLRLAICQGFDQYANVRPARILPGISSPLRGRGRRTSTGSSSGRTARGSIRGSAAGPIAACPKRSAWRSRSSHAPGYGASWASPSIWLAAARAGCSPW